jgi:hypothetical protein
MMAFIQTPNGIIFVPETQKPSVKGKDDLSQKTVCIIDTGLALHIAPLLAKSFGRVLYYLPDSDAYRKSNKAQIGTGIDGVIKINRLFDYVDDIDLFIFPDACMVDLQKYLRKRGKAVVGCFDSDRMELDKDLFYSNLKAVKLPVADYEIVIGVEDLRECLEEITLPVHIKLKNQDYRGITETFRCVDADAIDPVLDDICSVVGRYKDKIQFIVQDQINSKCETGFDTFCLNGECSSNPIVGIEGKDEWYIARVFPQVPSILKDYLNKTAPIFKELGIAGHRSTEIRITEDKECYGIDETCRMPSPPGELFPELYQDGDYAQAMWDLGHGKLPKLTVKAECGVQLNLMSSSLAGGAPVKVIFPKEISRYVKLKNYLIEDDGSVWVIPNDCDDYLGAVVAVGRTIEEAAIKCQEYAKQIKAHKMTYEDDIITCSRESRNKAAEFGVII